MASTTHVPVVGPAEELAVFSGDAFGRRVLFDGERMRAVLVALEPGQEVPLHAPQLDLVVSVLAGIGRVMAGGEERWVRAGDVAVIPAGARRGLRAEGARLVVLNVVSPPPTDADHASEDHAAWPEPGPAPDVGELIRHEHQGLREEVERLGVLAEVLPMLNGKQARRRLGEVTRFLREGLLPHAEEEERSVYPAVERVLGAIGGATRTMAVDHRRIAALVADLEKLGAGSIEGQQAPLRRVLHELRALLEVHLQKEEEVYLPALAGLSPDERRSLYARLAGDQPVEES
jgi:quercetin dioxygenase-like cupin family protein/hemerythrin-like domain-containing protein